MAKISLSKPTAGYNLAAINDNFTKLESEFQNKVLYRNNPVGEPNTMEVSIDMNSNDFLNVRNINGAPIGDLGSAITDIQEFNALYLGSKTSDPTVDNLGDPLQEGALYFNSVVDAMRVYTGSVWVDTGSQIAAIQSVTSFNGTGVQTVFTLPTTPAASENVAVYVGGVFQEAGSYTIVETALTFSEAPPSGTGNIDVIIFNPVSPESAEAVMYTPSGVGATQTTVQAKLRITAADAEARELESSQPCYAAVAVNFTRAKIDRHAFEDWSQLNTTDTGMGYCSFDAKPTLTNGLAQDHLVGYQSRSIYAGSANLTGYWHGYNTALVHNGTGTVTQAAGVYVRDVAGTGPIIQNYGVYIAQYTRGATNYAIYSDAGNAHTFGGPTGSIITGTIQASGLNFGVDTVSKTISYGFGTAGQTNFGIHKFYNGKNSVVAQIDNSGVSITGGLAVSGVAKFGAYAFASLPASTEGYMCFCTNGRKVGEGPGAGTGVPVYYDGAGWRVFSTDAIVTV